MRTRLKCLSRPEIDFLKDNCNFSAEETTLIDLAVRDNSDTQIADKLGVSLSSVTKIKRRIRNKIFDFLEVSVLLTTIYVNGERLTKDELKNCEIQIEAVKRIIAEKLTKKE